MLIRHCTALPEKFPVTDKMVFPHGKSSMKNEMKVIVLTLMDLSIKLQSISC